MPKNPSLPRSKFESPSSIKYETLSVHFGHLQYLNGKPNKPRLPVAMITHQTHWVIMTIAMGTYLQLHLGDQASWSKLPGSELAKVLKLQILHKSGHDRIGPAKNARRKDVGVGEPQNFAAMCVVIAERGSARAGTASGHNNRVGRGGIDVACGHRDPELCEYLRVVFGSTTNLVAECLFISQSEIEGNITFWEIDDCQLPTVSCFASSVLQTL